MKPSAALVLDLLRQRGPDGATALEALRAGAGDSLAQRVHELKAEGVQIAEAFETTPNGARVKRWFLAAEPHRAIDWPVGKPRECPSCRDWHCAGQTCDMNRAAALTGAVFPPAAPVSAAARI